MVTTRDFNASTTIQNEAVDTLLKCGFYPSKIRLNGYEVEMRYNYKDTQHDDFSTVVVVYPSGQYKLIDCDEVCGVYTLEQVVEYFQKKIVYGNWFEFMVKSDYKQVTSGSNKEDNKVTTYTINDAVKMVLSEDYKERFIAEYVETKIRYERLHNIIIKWCAGKTDFVTDIDLLEEQEEHMGNYLKVLEIRAVKEDIKLPDVVWRN